MKEDLFRKVVTDVSMAGNFCSVLFTKEIKKEKKQQGFEVIWSRVLLIWQIGRREILRKAKKKSKSFPSSFIFRR